MQIRNRSHLASRAGGFTPRVAPITGVSPAADSDTAMASGEDLVNHYFMEALMRRLEELEYKERQRAREAQRQASDDFQSWLKVPVNEQDTAPAPNKFTREKAINTYRKIANMDTE